MHSSSGALTWTGDQSESVKACEKFCHELQVELQPLGRSSAAITEGCKAGSSPGSPASSAVRLALTPDEAAGSVSARLSVGPPSRQHSITDGQSLISALQQEERDALGELSVQTAPVSPFDLHLNKAEGQERRASHAHSEPSTHMPRQQQSGCMNAASVQHNRPCAGRPQFSSAGRKHTAACSDPQACNLRRPKISSALTLRPSEFLACMHM